MSLCPRARRRVPTTNTTSQQLREKHHRRMHLCSGPVNDRAVMIMMIIMTIMIISILIMIHIVIVVVVIVIVIVIVASESSPGPSASDEGLLLPGRGPWFLSSPGIFFNTDDIPLLSPHFQRFLCAPCVCAGFVSLEEAKGVPRNGGRK